MSAARKFKAKQLKELRKKSKKDLLKQVDDLKKELHQLRVAQVSGGAPAKVANIRTTRKNIARIYTIISQITKQKVREEIKRRKQDKLPLDLRPKLTRRERLRLPKELRFKKTNKQRKLIKKYPRRKFAVINLNNAITANIKKQNVKMALTQNKSSNKYIRYLRKKQRAVIYMKRRKKQGIKYDFTDKTYNQKKDEKKTEEKE
eukprot:92620_1